MECKCCKGYEFDTLGLYFDLKYVNLSTLKYLLDRWEVINLVNLDNVTWIYRQFNKDWTRKYGMKDAEQLIKYLDTKGTGRINFFNSNRDETDDYINMYNFLNSHKSLCLFIGELHDDIESEYTLYCKCHKIPCIHIEKEEDIIDPWVGTSDNDLNQWNDNLS